MIHVIGQATLKVPYVVELDMTPEQFDALSERKMDDLINDNVDWQAVMRNAVITDIDIDEVEDAE